MKISIITAVHNAVTTLQDTFDSVQSQRFSSAGHSIGHIVIDGASTDGSVELIRQNQHHLEQWISAPDQGIYHAMNKGIAMADGDIVGLLNADDVFQDAHVLDQVASCFADPEIDACYGDLVYVAADDPGRVIRYWRSGEYQPGSFERGWMPAHPTFYVRREVYEKLGMFNLKLKLQSDFELTARFMAVHGIHTRYLPQILVRMRLGGATNRSFTNILRGNLESYRACRALGMDLTPKYFLSKFAMRIPQFFRSPE